MINYSSQEFAFAKLNQIKTVIQIINQSTSRHSLCMSGSQIGFLVRGKRAGIFLHIPDDSSY